MCFVCSVFFSSLIVHIKGEYFFSQYTFQQTTLSNHQRYVLTLKTYVVLCFVFCGFDFGVGFWFFVVWGGEGVCFLVCLVWFWFFFVKALFLSCSSLGLNFGS